MATIEKRALKTGEVRYKAIVRLRGHPLRTKTCRTRAAAQRWALKVENDIRDGRDVASGAEQRRTVAELLDAYRSEVLPKFNPRDRRHLTTQVGWWKDRLGACRVSDVRRSDVREGLRALARGETPSGRPASVATRNRYLGTLRRAFSVAKKQWDWAIAEDPASGLAETEPRGRVRILSDDERARLLRATEAEPRLHLIVVLALSTGARQGELLRLRWRDVDFKRGVAIVHESKNDERRALLLTGAALDLLRNASRVRRIDSDLVFVGSRGKASFPRKPWLRALEQVGIDDFRFHDLRHSAASYLAMSGATLAEIAEVLGHKTLAMVKRYSHLTEQHTRGVVERMNARIFTK